LIIVSPGQGKRQNQEEKTMKSNFVRSIVFASAALVLGATAYAQTSAKMVADIGFSFRSNSSELPAGRYTVTMNSMSGTPVFLISNAALGRSVWVTGTFQLGPKPHTAPHLTFRCGSVTCALSEIWMGESDPGHQAPKVKLTPGEKERLAVVPMTVGSKAD
jgi:hypothetical protein